MSEQPHYSPPRAERGFNPGSVVNPGSSPRTIVDLGQSPVPESPISDILSEREVKILKLYVQGHTKQEIAAIVGVEPHTIYADSQHTLKQLGAKTDAGAILMGMKDKTIKPELALRGEGASAAGFLGLQVPHLQVIGAMFLTQGGKTEELVEATGFKPSRVKELIGQIYRETGFKNRGQLVAGAAACGNPLLRAKRKNQAS